MQHVRIPNRFVIGTLDIAGGISDCQIKPIGLLENSASVEAIQAVNLLIQKELSERKELASRLSQADKIHIEVSKTGSCYLSLQDASGQKKHFEVLFENNEKVKLLWAMKNSLKTAVRKRKSAKEKKQSGEKRRGKFSPRNILYQRWFRMYKRISELFPEMEMKNFQAKSKLKTFLIQYLQRVAAIARYDLSSYELSERVSRANIESSKLFSFNPLSPVLAGYHRSYGDANIPLYTLNSQTKKYQSMYAHEHVMSVSDATQFAEMLKQQMDHVCHVAVTDDEDTLKEKIKQAMNKTSPTGTLAILFDLPDMDEIVRDKLESFKNMVNELAASVREELGYPKQKNQFEQKEENEFKPDYVYLLGINAENYPLGFVWISPSTVDVPYIKGLCAQQGFTPTMQQTARALGKVLPLETLPEQFDLFYSSDDLRVGSLLVNNFAEFKDNPTYKQFKKFAEKNLKHDHGLLADNLCKYIEGLEKYSVDKVFSDANIAIFLKELYAQMLNFMEVIMALDYKDYQAKVLLSDFSSLIFENANLMIDMCVPAQEAKDQLRDLIKHKVLPHVHAEIRPAVCGLVNSGSRCINMITEVFRESRPDDAKALNVMAFQDSYFEVLNSLKGSDAKKIGPPYDTSIETLFNQLEKSTHKLDVLYVDPEGSLDSATPCVCSHNVSEIIDKAFAKKAVNIPFTVVMDTTIGKIDDKKLTALINKHQDKIKSGQLKLVCYRSIQKFEQFGKDKISGGCFQVYSNDDEFAKRFQQVAEKEEKDVEPINHKVLAHLYANCIEGLDDYRDRCFANTDYVYKRIDPAFVIPTHLVGMPILIDERKDATNHFISIRGDYEAFLKDPTVNELLISERGSFGFNYTTYGKVRGSDLLRLSIGIEDRSQMDVLVQAINRVLLRSYLQVKIKAMLDHIFTFDKDKLIDSVVEFCDKKADSVDSANNYLDEVVRPAIRSFSAALNTRFVPPDTLVKDFLLPAHLKATTVPRFVADLDKKLEVILPSIAGSAQKENIQLLRVWILKSCNSQDYVEKTLKVLLEPAMQSWLTYLLHSDFKNFIARDVANWDQILKLNDYKFLTESTWLEITAKIRSNPNAIKNIYQALLLLEKAKIELPDATVILRNPEPIEEARCLVMLHKANLLNKPLVQQYVQQQRNITHPFLNDYAADLLIKIYDAKLEKNPDIINAVNNNSISITKLKIIQKLLPIFYKNNLQEIPGLREKLLDARFEVAENLIKTFERLCELKLERNPEVQRLCFIDSRNKKALDQFVKNLEWACEHDIKNVVPIIRMASTTQDSLTFREKMDSYLQLQKNGLHEKAEILQFYNEPGGFGYYKCQVIAKLADDKVVITDDVIKLVAAENIKSDEQVKEAADRVRTSLQKSGEPAPVESAEHDAAKNLPRSHMP